MQEINQNNNNNLTGKLIVLAVLVFVSWAATFFVWGLMVDRQQRQEEASNEISEQWSKAQLIAGPVLTVPVEKTTLSSIGEKVVSADSLVLLPKKLLYESDIKSQILTKGVYDTAVYTTVLTGTGAFNLSDIDIESSGNIKILWDKAVVSIGISDTRGIGSMFAISLNNKSYQLLPSSQFVTLDENGVHAPVAIDPAVSEYTFSFTMPLKGSRELSFLPLGENTDVRVNSDWKAPNFKGEFLPTTRNITADGFNAQWNITSYGKNVPQYWLLNGGAVSTESLSSKTFGIGLYQEVDFYTMINRSIKYSILFISLTFLTFYMYEILAGLRIHPMQYMLVGFAIALFYLLLLSFSEIIGFLSAYLVSTGAITILITGYCFSVLKAKKKAFTITGLLSALYGYLYILLQLEEFSLLFGSLLLFSVLATIMFITRNLDWYSLTKTDHI